MEQSLLHNEEHFADDFGQSHPALDLPSGQAPPRPKSPRPARPKSPNVAPARTPTTPRQAENDPNQKSAEWEEFQKMTQKITETVHKTQSKLQEISQNSTVKNLPEKPYDSMKNEPKAPPVNLLEEEIPQEVKTPPEREWKPISAIIDEEIKKEKALRRPARPPPPRGAPPPIPGRSSGPPAIDPFSWDDDTAQYYAQVPSYDEVKKQQSIDPESNKETVTSVTSSDSGFPQTSELNFDPSQSQVTLTPAFQEATPRVLEATLSPTHTPQNLETPGWASLENCRLPTSDSDFFGQLRNPTDAVKADPFALPDPKKPTDLLTTVEEDTPEYDPFEVKPLDEILAHAKAEAQAKLEAEVAAEDVSFFGQEFYKGSQDAPEKDLSADDKNDTGFFDDFQPPYEGDEPLYEEDDTSPLPPFPPPCTNQGWELMIRYPLKKKAKLMSDRYWKSEYVQIRDNVVLLFHSKNDQTPFQEIPLQASTCLSNLELNQFDAYSKIHVVKLQHVVYKERVGVRTAQIPKLMDGQFSKLGLPLEHAALTSQIVKLGALCKEDLQSFIYTIENILFRLETTREPNLPPHKQDEIQIHVYDEYHARIGKTGAILEQQGRVRLFCLAFLSGTNVSLDIGLNDRRREGKEVVRRKDILPMYTDKWIRYESVEFHSSVDQTAFQQEHTLKLSPLDACFFEMMRFRIRPPPAKELPILVKAIMQIAGSKIEIRVECLVTGFKSRKSRQVPCEDIQIRFPIPEAWIYLFREEKHWGIGSIHSRTRRPGKVKNIKDRLIGMVQHSETCLIEVATGEAKYEHLFRSLVWRIPKLPEKHHGAYKNHILRCRFQLSSFDLMPEEFLPNCEVDYTMPLATVSHTVVRSIAVEGHSDPDSVEKFIRYVAKYQYKTEIDYVEVAELHDIDAIMDPTSLDPEAAVEKQPVRHQSSFGQKEHELNEGYESHQKQKDAQDSEVNLMGELPEEQLFKEMKSKASFSSDDSNDDTSKVSAHNKFPLIQIDMSGWNN